MELTIKKQVETPLLSRTRVTAELNFTGTTPSNDQVAESLASKMGVGKDLVKVRHIYGRFGKQFAKVIANVYSDKKEMDIYEVKTKFLKQKAEEEKKKAEEAKKKAEEEAKAKAEAEAAAKETPAEEKAEEKTEEKAEEKTEVKAEEKTEEKAEPTKEGE